MFFIPIAVVVIVFWLIVNAVQEGRFEKTNAKAADDTARSQRLRSMVYDSDASTQAELSMRRSVSVQNRRICRFMNGGEDWEQYAGNLDDGSRFTLAMTAALAPNGKLPMAMLGVGTRIYGRSPSMPEETWQSMTEDFFMKTEQTLRDRGVPALALCRRGWHGSTGGIGPWLELRDYLEQNGLGSTVGFEFCFTSK
jgi:hypothetical protein